MQMEGPAQRIWRLACDLCLGESLDEKGCSASGVSTFAATGNHSNPSKCYEPGFYLYQSVSRRHGCFEKTGLSPLGERGGGWNIKLHMVTASDRDGVAFVLSAGNCGDAPEGRALLRQLGPSAHPVCLLIDRAYEGDETRTLAVELGCIPIIPPKSNRKILGIMISSYTSSTIKLRDFSAASKDFVACSLVMINLTSSF